MRSAIESAPYDFLSRYAALQRIQATSPGAFKFVLGLRLLVVLILSSPLLVRLSAGKDEYAAMVEAQQARAYEGYYERRLARESARGAARGVNSRLPVPGFGQGFAGAIDWTGLLSPSIEDLRGGDGPAEAADAAALAGDWQAVGHDLKKVIDKHGAKST